MHRFYYEGSNCHDSYVNLVNDKLAAITFSKPEDFSLVSAELKSLTRRLRNLAKKLSAVKPNTEKLKQFIENTTYKTISIYELAQLIDPEMGYIYPEHIKGFVSTIMSERIKNFKEDMATNFSTPESRTEYLRKVIAKPKNKKSILFFRDPLKILTDKISDKYHIDLHTMKPEFDLILKIIRATNSIANKYPCEKLLAEIYNTVGLYRNSLTPSNIAPEYLDQYDDQLILNNLSVLLNGSEFTIEKFLKLDLESRWHLTIYPNGTLNNKTTCRFDVLNADDYTLQTYIKCKQLLFKIDQGKECLEECNNMFRNLGIRSDSDLEPDKLEHYLKTICNTMAAILVPFKINPDLYGSFDPEAIDFAIEYLDTYRDVASNLKICPIKLLQLSRATLHEVLYNHEIIAQRCKFAGITTTSFFELPKNEVEMILNTEYYIHRLPVLTRAYFLSPNEFLDASIEQKKAWLECPASAKQWFNHASASFGPIKPEVVLQVISNHTTTILDKLVATEALLYIKELNLAPWDIVLELQKSGFKYNQCRTIFKALSYINREFEQDFINRFTGADYQGFSQLNLNFYKKSFELIFGTEAALIAYRSIKNYVADLSKVLDVTAHTELPKDFQNILGCKEQDEIIINMASNLCESNLFCKHLRLYKKTLHAALLEKLVVPDSPYVRLSYCYGDQEIFSMLYAQKDEFNYREIHNQFEAIDYDARNVQELSVFGCAVETNDLVLINIISNSIKHRSKKDIQQFLIENGFNKPQRKNLLFTFASGSRRKNDLDSSTINAIHPITGDTPLLTAIRQRNSRIALSLISWGADFEAQDTLGLTPLMLASKHEIESIVLDINDRIQHLKLLADQSNAPHSTKHAVRL